MMTNPGTLQEKMNLPISQHFVHCNIQPTPPPAHLKCLCSTDTTAGGGTQWKLPSNRITASPAFERSEVRKRSGRPCLTHPTTNYIVECSFHIMFYQVPPSRPSQMHHLFPAARQHATGDCGMSLILYICMGLYPPVPTSSAISMDIFSWH